MKLNVVHLEQNIKKFKFQGSQFTLTAVTVAQTRTHFFDSGDFTLHHAMCPNTLWRFLLQKWSQALEYFEHFSYPFVFRSRVRTEKNSVFNFYINQNTYICCQYNGNSIYFFDSERFPLDHSKSTDTLRRFVLQTCLQVWKY